MLRNKTTAIVEFYTAASKSIHWPERSYPGG